VGEIKREVEQRKIDMKQKIENYLLPLYGLTEKIPEQVNTIFISMHRSTR
jgi:hypothetical protein